MPTSRSTSHRHQPAHPSKNSQAPTQAASVGSNATLPKSSSKGPSEPPSEVRDFSSGNPDPKGNHK